jgi:hypothetical protein
MEVSGRTVTVPLEQVEAIRFASGRHQSQLLAREAVDAVLSLRSVVKSGVAYRDYAPRVLDARVSRFVSHRNPVNPSPSLL